MITLILYDYELSTFDVILQTHFKKIEYVHIQIIFGYILYKTITLQYNAYTTR